MEQDGSSSTTRKKLRFAPKPPPRRKPRPPPPKKEAGDEDVDEAKEAKSLLRQFNENLTRRGSRAEKKSSVQVAFGPGATHSSSIRTFGVDKARNSYKSSDVEPKVSESSDSEKIISPLPLDKAGTGAALEEVRDLSTQTVKKEYKEPWDYNHSYYPITLPLRPPYSGDPELLNEAEFGEAARNKEYDETAIHPASELGLMEENGERKMFFFQLPATLPMVKQSASSKGKEKVGSSTSSGSVGASSKGSKLEELHGGCMGKMLVYKSGAVKLKLGDTLFDVSPGSDFQVSQNVVAINTAKKECNVLGELNKLVVVSPDVCSVLNSVIDLG
ncbi:uncharacterized protein LOC107414218 [Ziziphus jujuba]|uniref:Uncharacterized protein LOC107414218 n=1 Tax=Ziziphus jujuba TaxID=326968 RepID=A0A6P3ZHV5_ZIZJJ|nr:uncharacterized protein LOC107414218 [Ziziphus jujuba]